MNRSITSGKGAWNKSFTVLKLLFLLASCTTDFDGASGTPGANDPAPLLVKNITIEENTVATRAATAPAVGSSIGVFRQTDSYYTTASNNIKYTLSTDKGWQPATAGTDILLGSNDSRALLYAYHPAGDKIAVKADNVTIDLAARAYDADYDLSYVPAGQAQALDVGGLVYNYHPGVNFTMRRAYTQLGVDLTRGDDYGGAGAVTAVSLTVNGGGKLYSGGTQNIATGAYTAGTADINKITYTVPADTKITPAAKTASFRHLLPPGKSGAISDLTLTATVDGMTTRTTISAAGLDLKAGTRYVVKATLNYTGLAATIKTTDWDSQPSWKEEVTFVPIVPPGPIDIGLDFLIAPGNLIATADGNGGYRYAFAEDQGYYSKSSASGDYFRWNTLDPAATTSSNMTGVWDDSNDPCRQVKGGEWHTPTEENLNALNHGTPGGQQDVWLQVRGTYRTKSGKEVRGYYFGTKTAPSEANQDKYVFLPMASWYDENNAWQDWGVDTWGMYWSSTPGYSSEVSRLILSYDSGTHVGTTLWYSAYYNYGIPLRCVKDKPKPKPAHAIDLEGLDFYVADGNLIATADGNGGFTYAFAEWQGYYSMIGKNSDDLYDFSNGDYFSWNTLEPNIYYGGGRSWDDALDPCRLVDDGKWRTPSQAQWEAMKNVGNVWGTYTKNGITVNGCYVGTSDLASTTGKQDDYVFLPASGTVSYYVADNTFHFFNGDELGSYRSTDDSAPYAQIHSYYNGIEPWGGLDYSMNTLRCVRDK